MYIDNFLRVVLNLFTIFDDPDKIEIGKKEVDYYNNYYLKGIKHKYFSTQWKEHFSEI